jgi:hypothetical protein
VPLPPSRAPQRIEHETVTAATFVGWFSGGGSVGRQSGLAPLPRCYDATPVTLLERFDRQVAELRSLFEDAQRNAAIIAQLRAFVGQGRPGRPPGRSGRPRGRRPALSAEKQEQIKQRIARFLARAREGARSGAIAKAVGLTGFRLRRLLDELRRERKLRMEGDRGGARYYAASSKPGPITSSLGRTSSPRRKPRATKTRASKTKPTKTRATKPKATKRKATKPRVAASSAKPMRARPLADAHEASPPPSPTAPPAP